MGARRLAALETEDMMRIVNGIVEYEIWKRSKRQRLLASWVCMRWNGQQSESWSLKGCACMVIMME